MNIKTFPKSGFPDHIKEREIDILKYVEQDLEEVVGNRGFEELEEDKKQQVIEELEKRWSNPESEIKKRISSFKEKSPDVLGVILGEE